MEVNITNQAMEAAYALLLGAACGVFYDLLSIFRRPLITKAGKVFISAIFDIIFCIVSAAGFFMLGFGPGEGKLRLFLLFFLVPGGALYFMFLSKWVTKALYSLLKFIRFIIYWCFFPFRLLNRQQKKLRKTAKNRLRYVYKRSIIEKSYKADIIKPPKKRSTTTTNE